MLCFCIFLPKDLQKYIHSFLLAYIVEIQISKLLRNLRFQILSSMHIYLLEKYIFWSYYMENYLLYILIGFCVPYFMHTYLTAHQMRIKEYSFRWKRSETQPRPPLFYIATSVSPWILHKKLKCFPLPLQHLQIIQLLTFLPFNSSL